MHTTHTNRSAADYMESVRYHAEKLADAIEFFSCYYAMTPDETTRTLKEFAIEILNDPIMQ